MKRKARLHMLSWQILSTYVRWAHMMKGMPKEARMVIATSIHQSTQASTTMLWPKRGTAISTMQFTMVASAIGIVPANMALHRSTHGLAELAM